MSCYEWEHAILTLPAAEVAGLKKALRDYVNTLHDEVRAEAVRIHKEVAKSTRSAILYKQRLDAHTQARYARSDDNGRSYRVPTTREARTDLVASMAREVLSTMLRGGYNQPAPTPHQPTVADVNKVIEKATNRTNTFGLIGRDGYREGNISFEGRTVTWAVPENNHAIETARESPVADVFFNALAAITWTRGTGGVFWSNNEYNEGEHGYGRGPDIMGGTYGPLGDQGQVDRYVSLGFTLKAAKQAVADAKRPSVRRYAW